MNKVLLLALLLASTSQAQWSADPNNNLIVGYGQSPELCSDSSGGAYITYIPELAYPTSIRLLRLNRYGYQPWGTPRVIQGLQPESRFANITSDGGGGVVIAYLDRRWNGSPIDPHYNDRVRIQRVDSSGNLLWGNVGVRVTADEHRQSEDLAPGVVSDASGGCIVAWVDSLGSLRINRIDGSGNRVWGDSGRTLANPGTNLQIVPDGRHGCILTYGGSRLQRIDSTGNKLWDPNGILVSDMTISQIVGDGLAGIIVAGWKFISYNNGDPYYAAKCQRVDSTGQTLWGLNGLTLADSVQNIVLNHPRITLSLPESEESISEWYRRVNPDTLRTFTQRVRRNGSTVFQQGGIVVSFSNATRQVSGQLLISGMSSSSIHAWSDNRNPSGIYAQRIDSMGQGLWGQYDVALFLISVGGLKITTDRSGGAIVVGWRETDFTVRAQQISRNGNLGEIITSVSESNGNMPKTVLLMQNYPNPFNSTTRIRYDLPSPSYVDIGILNVLGQRVQTVIQQFEQSGFHEIDVDATNLSSGLYFVQLQTPHSLQVRKALFLK
jgi:hypothetical protein